MHRLLKLVCMIVGLRVTADVASDSSPYRGGSSLEIYFNETRRGPYSARFMHYFDIYERHLARFRQKAVSVVEIGVNACGGMKMWRWFFGEAAHLVGIDNRFPPKFCLGQQRYGRPNKIAVGDVTDISFWKRFKKRNAKVDVVIDDAGHSFETMSTALDEMWPHISLGGVYIIEDVTNTNPSFSRYVFDRFISSDFQDAEQQRVLGLNAGSWWPSHNASKLQATVAEVAFYPHVIVLQKVPAKRTVLQAVWKGSEAPGCFRRTAVGNASEEACCIRKEIDEKRCWWRSSKTLLGYNYWHAACCGAHLEE